MLFWKALFHHSSRTGFFNANLFWTMPENKYNKKKQKQQQENKIIHILGVYDANSSTFMFCHS